MKFVSMTSLFKTGVLLLPFAFAACTSDDSSSWLDRPESFGEVVYNRHLARGTSAAFDCKVYSRDNHLTMEMEFDVKMYESTMNTVFDFEVGDPSVFYVDVLLSGMFEASSDDVCSDVKDMDEITQKIGKYKSYHNQLKELDCYKNLYRNITKIIALQNELNSYNWYNPAPEEITKQTHWINKGIKRLKKRIYYVILNYKENDDYRMLKICSDNDNYFNAYIKSLENRIKNIEKEIKTLKEEI